MLEVEVTKEVASIFSAVSRVIEVIEVIELWKKYLAVDVGVSKNRGGPPKWMVYNGKPYYNG